MNSIKKDRKNNNKKRKKKLKKKTHTQRSCCRSLVAHSLCSRGFPVFPIQPGASSPRSVQEGFHPARAIAPNGPAHQTLL